MNSLRNKFAAWTAIAVLGASSLFAVATSANSGHRRGRPGAFVLSHLNLTADQQAKTKSIFQAARQEAKPVREQLQQTRQSLHAAIQADNAAQIQQLAATEGNEVGQLAAIRSTAFAKVYQVLTPDQQQKLTALHQARKAARRTPAAGAQN